MIIVLYFPHKNKWKLFISVGNGEPNITNFQGCPGFTVLATSLCPWFCYKEHILSCLIPDRITALRDAILSKSAQKLVPLSSIGLTPRSVCVLEVCLPHSGLFTSWPGSTFRVSGRSAFEPCWVLLPGDAKYWTSGKTWALWSPLVGFQRSIILSTRKI